MFKKIPANKMSISFRKLSFGVGINDADYITQPTNNGVRSTCPAYRVWRHMLERCYCKKFHLKQPTYIHSTVCNEWLTFSSFAEWFDMHNISGYQLDKDIKVLGNKIYSPDTCMFVPECVNKLLNKCDSIRGRHATGVSFHKMSRRFASNISIDGKSRHLGLFSTPGEAREEYKIAKNAEIIRKSKQYPEFEKYLMQHLHKVMKC